MAAEEDFVLSFTGEETDNLLKHTESMKNQTTADDGETVQVYDTNGVPHKVSKTELLKKSTLALPALEDISSFVAINAAGNAVGVMTKEQVASVLAGLMGINETWIRYEGVVKDANKCNINRIYMYNVDMDSINGPGISYGLLIDYGEYNYGVQQCFDVISHTVFYRTRDSNGLWEEIWHSM